MNFRIPIGPPHSDQNSRMLDPAILPCSRVPRIAADQTWFPRGNLEISRHRSELGTTWRNLTFDDSGWKWGPAQLGYGDGDEATLVNMVRMLRPKFITTYFRKTFSVADASLFSNLALRVLRDDGVIIPSERDGDLPQQQHARGHGDRRHACLHGHQRLGGIHGVSLSNFGNGHARFWGTTSWRWRSTRNSGTSSDISFDLELVGITPARPSITRVPLSPEGHVGFHDSPLEDESTHRHPVDPWDEYASRTGAHGSGLHDRTCGYP